MVGDLALAAAWVCAGALVKLLVYGPLGFGGRPEAEAVKGSLSIVYMFIFARLEAATGGASYNPLTILAAAVASHGGPAVYLFTAFVRIPAQVINVPDRDVCRQLVILSSFWGPKFLKKYACLIPNPPSVVLLPYKHMPIDNIHTTGKMPDAITCNACHFATIYSYCILSFNSVSVNSYGQIDLLICVFFD